MNKITHIVILTLIVSVSFNFEYSSQIKSKIHKASQNIKNSVNHNLITESLFKQIRPRANITNKDLLPEEIDKRVRKYIYENYLLVLLQNYEQIYSTMIKAKKDFTNCNSPTPFESNVDILKALCLSVDNSIVEVKYMINAYAKGWSTSSIFIFTEEDGNYKLTEIDIMLSGDKKSYIEGI